MKQISVSSQQREVLTEELHKALGEHEQLSEENLQLSEQLPPGPLYARQISVDPVELDDGEWRVR